MHLDDRGSSTVEALVALTLFTLVALSTAASAAVSLRAATDGSHAARAARLATKIAQQLGCESLAPGQEWVTSGESARWWFEPAPGGAVVHIEVSYPTARRQHSDSLWSFVRC